MHIGVTLRNMGPQSHAATMRACACHAEANGFESIWITDHIAIPPDDAQGSGGRYTDPLTTLAWLGGFTAKIKLGTGALILPYRPILPTAKAIATVHELTGLRLLLGVGIGWMAAEFRALGIPRSVRGRVSDEQLAFLAECFEKPVVNLNGQPFIFDPRPSAPPIYIGGQPPQAFERALRFGHGWLPMARSPQALAADMTVFAQMAADRGVTHGPVTVLASLSLNDPDAALAQIDAYRELGIERLICALRYDAADQYQRQLDELAVLCGNL